ncbi:uncharacterized protein LOC127372547 isoform X2 [Dicentrarchus labrax]|uniref:uncharacterized protein LOC127372547 isoform X2 n=1 Tax=Dicentrarchus labrax TaxID=13489 RepID=UPI0021F5CFF2|nr:uncharacterized protein LOC127372547 isoform X2 [Dicentrarchus labrax]
MAGRLLFVFLMYSFHEIQVQARLPPKLKVNSPVITETDSVTLSCEAPSSVSVSQCYFYTVSGGNVRSSSCMKRLTGTELLLMSHQSSPAEVEVKCYYTVKVEDLDSPSPHSNISTITIHSQTPQMSLQHFDGEYVLFVCSLPGSANHDTRCNLYFGEESDPVVTTTIWKKRSSTNQWFCQFIVTTDDLLKRLSLVKQGNASCDYSLGSEPNSLSPRSDRYRLTDIVEKESGMIQRPTVTKTTGSLTSSQTTLKNPASDDEITGSLTSTHTTLNPASDDEITVYSAGRTVSTSSDTDSSVSTFLTSVKPEKGSLTSTQTTLKNPASDDEITVWPVTSSNTGGATSTSLQPVKPASAETWIWKLIAVAGCGLTVGVIVLSVIHCKKRRAVYSAGWTVSTSSDTDRSVGSSVSTFLTSVKPEKGSEEVKEQQHQNETNDTYHLYSTISEEPAASALTTCETGFGLQDMVYSTVQAH